MAQRKRYAIVGTGGRAGMYVTALTETFAANNELVGLCDPSPTRMAYYNRQIAVATGRGVPAYPAGEFDRMIDETRPDVVIVTSMDSTHHEYIVRAMQLGCDAITEKPMTIDAPKACRDLRCHRRDRQERCGNLQLPLRAAHHQGARTDHAGCRGQAAARDFQWVLDTSHGADYFRRWHREKDKSGGLLVHKATHHFDIINWWIQSVPADVYAMGDLMFYGRAAAARRGEYYAYSRYTGEPAARQDPFSLFLDQDETLRALYLEAEMDSGYLPRPAMCSAITSPLKTR